MARSAHTQLVKSCLDAVRLDRHLRAFKTGTAKVPIVEEGKKPRFFQTGEPGVADITLVIGARPWAITLFCECKTGSGQQSREQLSWQEDAERLGAFYVVVRHPAELRSAIQRIRSWARGKGFEVAA